MRKFTLILFCLLLSAYAGFVQARTISGVIIDDIGEPAIGAAITVKGMPSVGTITDFDGRFSLSVPEGATHVVVSFVGMETQELPIASVMNIRLRSDAMLLGDVVITGMHVIDRRYVTGATDRLNASDVLLGGMTDVSRGLQGRSAGVSVQNVSGTFGTAPRIRVRGATSIIGDSRPLWVVDGVVVEPITQVNNDALSSGDALTLISSAIAGLNPDDIESFDILKDGSVTAIYGARAMAGVIVITTKRGRAGVSQVDYTGEFTYRMKPSYRNFNIMNSQEQMGVYQEMSNKGWLNLADVFRAREFGVYGRMWELIDNLGLIHAPEFRNAYLREAEMRNTDWFDLLFQNTLMHRHAVSISSGTDRAFSRVSLSAMFDPGWTMQSNVQLYTAGLNSTYRITDGLSVNLIANASHREQRAPGTLSQATDPVRGSVGRDFDINPFAYAMNTTRAADPNVFYRSNYAPFNILHELNNNFIDLNALEARFQGDIRWKPERLNNDKFGNIELGFMASMNYRSVMQVHNVTGRANQAMAYRAGVEPYEDNTIRQLNRLLYRDPFNPNSLPISVLPGATTGIYRNTNRTMKTFDTRASIQWIKVFNDKHLVNLFAGYETNLIDRYSNHFIGWGLDYDIGLMPTYIYEFFKQSLEQGNHYYGINETRRRQLAGFATVTYGYDRTYALNLTYRNEASNISSVSGSPWLPTWNVGLSWNAHEERFFDGIRNHISHLAFRTSYSLTASPVPEGITNSEILIQSFMPFRPFANIQEGGALRIIALQNSELTFEKKNEFNIGFDMGILRVGNVNRLNISFDVFERRNFDLVGWTTTPGVGGEIMKRANVADMSGSGFDLTVVSNNITNRDFTWNTTLTLGRAVTKITRFENFATVMEMVSGMGFAKQGFPARSLFSIPFGGLDENGFPIIGHEDGTFSSTRSFNFQNREHLDFLVYEGPVDPTITGGLANAFTYKRFTLNVFFNYAFGNVVRLDPIFNARYNDLTSMTREFSNRWVLPGDERYTNVPVILSRRQYVGNSNALHTTYNAYNYSTERIARGDFIRLKQLSLNYDLPQTALPENVNALSLRVEATNLFLLYADKKLNGQDPEFFNAGGVAVPTPRQFTLTLRASF